MEKEDILIDENHREPNKKCFIITPIGNELDPIREEIEGIAEEGILPILKKYNYHGTMAHTISATGQITKKVIENIYNADLIIANVSELNPNVMYELAFAHSLRKKTIMIKNDKTTLPFDIKTEETITYKNSFYGLTKFKSSFEKTLKNVIEVNESYVSNIIYDNLQSIENDVIRLNNIEKVKQKDPENVEIIDVIVDEFAMLSERFNILENNIKYNNPIIESEESTNSINVIPPDMFFDFIYPTVKILGYDMYPSQIKNKNEESKVIKELNLEICFLKSKGVILHETNKVHEILKDINGDYIVVYDDDDLTESLAKVVKAIIDIRERI